MSDSEEELIREVMPELSRVPGVYVMRNEANALVAYKRAIMRKLPAFRSLLEEEFRKVHDSCKYGLGIGSADTILVVEGMFLAEEWKAKSAQSPEQKNWQAWIERAGGMYRVCRTLEDGKAGIEEARARARR